jgi:protein-L-isoaspartate(D-aspartate) O-methyltransferase
LNNDTLTTTLEAAGVLGHERVAAAFRGVPRGLFLPDVPEEQVYADIPVYTRLDDRGGFIGGSDQPSQTAKLLTLSNLEAGQNVLQIGTGTGYTAALIQEIVGDSGIVTTLDIDKETSRTAERNLTRARKGAVHVVNVDGAAGYAPRASYDRIISTVALWDIPPIWLRQLRPNGLIAAPIYLDGFQVMAAFQALADGTLYSATMTSCSFVPMQGVEAPPPQHLYMGGGSALRLYSSEIRTLDSARLHLLMSNDAERCHLGAAPSAMDYWDGFVPYLMLNVPDNYEFVCYAVEGGKLVYGLSGRGFALITQGGATFVGANDLGDTHCFAGVDAFLEVDSAYSDWVQLGSPRIDTMRLWLIPNQADSDAAIPTGTVQYNRPHHHLHISLVHGSSDHDHEPSGRD